MKARESSMPPEEKWKDFFNPISILETMGVDSKLRDVADFGCGYGTFTIPAAKIVNGRVYAIDIDHEMIEATSRKAEEYQLNNVETILRDFVSDGSGLEDESVDYAMLFNILHIEKPGQLLKEAYRVLREGGEIGIIHWNYDPTTPRGPPMGIRPKAEQCIEWAVNAGFNNPRIYDLKPYHYVIVMSK